MKKARLELASLSDAQRDALDAIVKWHEDGGYPPLTLGGYAGTGKTVLTGLLPDVLPKRTRIAFAAYTGKAASVLASKLPPGARVSTLHKLLYQPVEMVTCAESGEMIPGKAVRCGAHHAREAECPAARQVSFTPVEDPLAGLDLVVVDEASMVPERLWADLTSHGVPVLAVGDHGQLPPVKSAFNLMKSPDITLEEIHRQAAGSPILAVARWAREQGHIPHGWYGENVIKIKPTELGLPGFGLHPAEADLIICATNATRVYHNAGVRALHGRSGPPAPGDVVICLKNDYDAGLFNGQRGVVTEVHESAEVRGVPAIRMTIQLDGMDVLWTGVVAAGPFSREALKPSIRDYPRSLALFDFGYALTGHKSQGSEADKVIVIEEGWPDPGTEMRRRWLYTAVTRSSRVLTIVGW
jgi:exodeoxyribonuclease-5